MIGNQLEQDIIDVFNRDLTRIHSINAISKTLNKSYPHINQKVNSLIDAGIIKRIPIGKSHMCTVDLNSDLGISYLTINEIKKKGSLPKDIKQVSEFLIQTKKTRNIIFSKGKLYVITDNKELFEQHKKKIVLITEEEFKQILLTEPSIIREHTIIQSYEHYFKTLRELQGQIISLSLL